jgi:toxin ParE1/3/4
VYSIIISFEADQDLFDILDYTEETFGESQRLVYFSQFKTAFERLAKMPSIGHSRSDIPLDTLALSVEQHTVIYEVIEHDKLVQILRILHSKMDF